MKNELATVLSNREIAYEIWQMDLHQHEGDMIEFSPGRFIHLKIPGASHLILRRPLGIHAFNRETKTFSIVYQLKGEGTRRLTKVMPKEEVEYLGPLGNGFSLPASAKRVFLVGGGVGLAPLRSVMEHFQDLCFEGYLGFRSKEHAYHVDVFKKHCQKVFIATEDGSLGEKGWITDVLKREMHERQPDLVLVCGPPGMAVAAQHILKEHSHVPAYVSLEERMACGVGACRGCVCKTRSEGDWTYQRVCKDGPVFDIREVIFDDENGSDHCRSTF